MESQQITPLHHHDPQNVQLHQGVEGELEGQHHEKKSVLKKVKAKAKKIKDTITKHGHGHDHHDDDYDDDDEDDVVMEDPQLQGAPLYEGAAMRSGVGGQGQQQDVGIGMSTTTMHNEPLPAGIRETTSRDPSAVEPNTTFCSSPWSLVEDPHAPKDKASDPAGKGNEEAGESEMFNSFAKMKVNNENKPNRTGAGPESQEPEKQTSYVQKIWAAGSAMSGKAMAAKDFMASKLKPGEEDRALSNIISEAFNRRKQQQQQPPKVGKVTESAEVTRRLGREEDEGSGTAAADTVKDTVRSWLGIGGDDQPPPSKQSIATSQGKS